MKIKTFALICVMLLSGCAVSVPKITDVNCTATYTEKTFPYTTYSLILIKMKDDNKTHQNVIWYKPKGLSPVKFAGGWAPASSLDNLKCQTLE